jgi:hypothetical protein
MRNPCCSTPEVFDYLWLYWVLRRFLPKDIVPLIIGNKDERKVVYNTLNNYFISSENAIIYDAFKRYDIRYFQSYIKMYGWKNSNNK